MSFFRGTTDPAIKEERNRLIIIGVFTTCFVGVLLVWLVLAVLDEPLQPDNFTNSFSTSPGGHSALVELLRDSGREVRAGGGGLRAPDDAANSTDTLALLEPRRRFVEKYSEEFESLFSTARQQHSSVVLALPKRTYRKADPQPHDGELVLWEGEVELADVNETMARAGFDNWYTVRRRTGKQLVEWGGGWPRVELDEPVQVFETLSAPPGEIEVLAALEDGSPVVVRWRTDSWRDRGGVILVSDPDFLTNRFISRPGGGEFCVALFDLTPTGGTILIDEDLHGFSSDASIEYLALTPPGLWVLLCGLLVLGLFGWRQATVLRPRETEPQDRQERKYVIEGLARMMERAADHHTACRRIIRRSRFVLGSGGAQVQGAGMTAGTVQKGRTGRITRIQGGNEEERLVGAARKVAHQKRTGETEHGAWE
jgi:hypothetical protein